MTIQMVPEVQATSEEVARIPQVFLQRGDISVYGLLQESGYFERFAAVTAEVLRTVLAREPSLVSDWLTYSENKRADAGWYFRQEPIGYVVGCVAHDGSQTRKNTYADRIEACSEYIKAEMEDIRRLG
jgi:hypothetical protein